MIKDEDKANENGWNILYKRKYFISIIFAFRASFCSQILISFYTFVVSEYAIPNPLLSLQTLNQFPSPLQPYLQSTHGAFW